MASNTNKKMRENWGRTLRNLVDYNLLNNEMIKFDRSEEALFRGVTKPQKIRPNFDEPLSTNKQKRLDQIRKLAPTERITISGIQTMVTLLTEQINMTMQPKYELRRGDDVGRSIRQIKKSGGEKLTQESLASLLIESRSNLPSRDKRRRDKQRVPFHWLKHSLEYRDPDKKGSGDPIHLGASRKEKRYAITKLQIWGEHKHSGRKGTAYEGLGYQPFQGKYDSFKRVGYPGRKRPDRVTRQHQFSIFWHYWQDDRRVQKIIEPVKNSMLKEFKIYTQVVSKRLKTEARKINRG